MRIFNYSEKDNSKEPTMAFEMGWLTVYYSYDTPIAFRISRKEGQGIVVIAFQSNTTQGLPLNWSTTTRKHIGYIKRTVGFSHQTDEIRLRGFLSFIESKCLTPMSSDLFDELSALLGDESAAMRI